ncbi:hypothetical protein [Psychrobacillus antarcticus]|uniref:hypothetical protein n=1 Tax=Psychrobacillus antarcticus TaxID=2879115 RepID=UPI002407A1CF|nr:hypothetical protein [Psychrobacillus antarcticus]
MKKIQLTDGLPVDIKKAIQSVPVRKLTEDIISISQQSGLNYTEINKALYLADKGLYEKVITNPQAF